MGLISNFFFLKISKFLTQTFRFGKISEELPKYALTIFCSLSIFVVYIQKKAIVNNSTKTLKNIWINSFIVVLNAYNYNISSGSLCNLAILA